MQSTYTIIQTPVIEQKARDMKPGTWVRIAWLDAPPTVALFVGYVGGSRSDGNYRKDYRGERSIKCFYLDATELHSHAVHTQVIEIIGALTAPA